MFTEPTITSSQQKGFTLIELVVVMVLSGILAVVVTVFLVHPIEAYTQTTGRATLVDAADMALRRMARDIQSAVPNSLRVKTSGGQTAVEFLNVVEGMRYRASLGGLPPGTILDFTKPITSFNVIGQFQYALNNPTCAANNCMLVVYNTGANGGSTDSPTAGANVYSTAVTPACSPGPNCIPPPGTVTITPVGTTVTLTNPASPPNQGNILMSSATQFAMPSPRQRIDIVDTPVSYVCNPASGTNNITRYSGYVITPVQAVPPSGATSVAQLTSNVTACSFTYSPGTPEENSVITMSITLTDTNGETITLMRQVGVDNSA